MPLKTNERSATAKSTTKKAGKTGIVNIMDDAPLFAGLDEYIVQQTVEKKAEITKADQVKEKKQTVPPMIQQATAAQPLPERAPKVQRAAATETNALLLSVAEMCTLLKISRATLVRMDKSGQLPGRIKLGGSVRFHRETVETWLRSLITTRHTP